MWPDDFNFDWSFQFPEVDWNFGLGNFDWQMPMDFSWAMPNFNWDFGGFNFADPLALPQYNDFFMSPLTGNQPDFSAFGIPDPGLQGVGGANPMMVSDLIDTQAFGGPGAAPTMSLPGQTLAQGSDPLTNLIGSTPFQGEPFMGLDDMGLGESPLTGGGTYASPGMTTGGNPFSVMGPESAPLGVGASLYGTPGGVESATKLNGEPSMPGSSKWDTIAKLAAAFGPVALGAAGMGLQAANRPGRNPLEDDLLRARISSMGTQDTLAKDRLAFERENAEAMREAQMEMQAALLESRRPGGQANIQALLKGNPQLAALYNALTTQTTGLANGGDAQFNAMIDQIAQVNIAELRRQADQQKAQAMEMAARQGVNPANIIAEIDQRFLQESAKARADARNVLIQQLAPGINVFNSVGGLFGNLFQTPAAG